MTTENPKVQAGGGVWLHRYAVFVSASTLFLIVAGAMVTSTGSGLAVPDWPLSYGMFFPPMVGGIFWEHGHRMVAGTVGILTLILAIWIWRVEARRWMRWLGFWALIAVILQAVLGGITVLWFLPAPVSIAHACLAQTFFCITVAIALFTSRGWRKDPDPKIAHAGGVWFPKLALLTSIAVYVQLLLGAMYRHMGTGLMFHITGAVVVMVLAMWAKGTALKRYSGEKHILRPSLLLGGLVLLQMMLGFAALMLVIVEREAVQPSIWQISSRTAHVAIGASILAASLFLTLRAYRHFDAKQPAVAAESSTAG